ncbi:DsbA family oxidoreductase [Marinobacter salicampi]|uniref:DsbA family oxidoreductase n=1 Tax=Marinobacter salicampi TaxID=435907 RepID=UPI001407FED4|nr:DsbA family oxidoreductase [Marinobacter salicampi]
MKTMKIDIVSDIACPWCAIGYARLELAMDRLADELDFEIDWHAFELNPDADPDGEPILKALSRKYGRSPEEMDAAQSDMTTIASELGLNFSRMKERRTRNTFDAHRLVKWAGEHGRQTEMKKAFFDAYFGDAENIADPEVLLARVETIGLDVNEARRILESDKFATDVRADEARYQQAGVSAVPAFIIDQTYMISGAQEPETLVQSFRQIASGAENPA